METAIVLLLLALCCSVSAVPLNKVQKNEDGLYVLIVGLDGLGSYYVDEQLLEEHAPTLYRLGTDSHGAMQYNANAYYQTNSKPNWAAFFHGAGPEQTGVHSNSWLQPPNWFWPTIFYQAHQYGMQTAMYTDHNVVLNLLNDGDADFLEYNTDSDELTDAFIDMIYEELPELAFIHYDDVDAGGHCCGWGSSEYFEMVEKVNEQTQRILNAYEDLGIHPLILVTSDHGGQGTGHGCYGIECFLIHFIVNGPHLQNHNRTLQLTRTQADIACMALEYLQIAIPPEYTCVSAMPELAPIAAAAAAATAVVPEALLNSIVLNYTSSFELGWNDQGSGADEDLSCWTPVANPATGGVFGSVCLNGYSQPTTAAPVVDLVRSAAAAFVVASSFNETWRDSGSGATLDGTYYNPICPAGFASLGEIAVEGPRQPPAAGTVSVVCIAMECLSQCDPGHPVWSTRGSGSDTRMSIWTVDPLYSYATDGVAISTASMRLMTNSNPMNDHGFDRPLRTTYRCLKEACIA